MKDRRLEPLYIKNLFTFISNKHYIIYTFATGCALGSTVVE